MLDCARSCRTSPLTTDRNENGEKEGDLVGLATRKNPKPTSLAAYSPSGQSSLTERANSCKIAWRNADLFKPSLTRHPKFDRASLSTGVLNGVLIILARLTEISSKPKHGAGRRHDAGTRNFAREFTPRPFREFVASCAFSRVSRLDQKRKSRIK